MINSLASILYSSSSNVENRQATKSAIKSQCQVNMLFRSSTPKTSSIRLDSVRTKSAEQGNVSSSDISSMKSANSTSFSSAPRCSTPVYSKQRRTRPFIVCELCRQRAFQTPKKTPQSKSNRHKRTPNDKDKSLQCFSKTKTTSNSTHRIVQHRQASVDQLLVWIV